MGDKLETLEAMRRRLYGEADELQARVERYYDAYENRVAVQYDVRYRDEQGQYRDEQWKMKWGDAVHRYRKLSMSGLETVYLRQTVDQENLTDLKAQWSYKLDEAADVEALIQHERRKAASWQ